MQFQLTYDAKQDRMLLRVNLGDRVLGFWLTRRCCRILWQVIQQRLNTQLVPGVTPQAQGWMKQMQHQQIDKKLDTTPEPTAAIAGEAILVMAIRHGSHSDGRHLIGLYDEQEQGETFVLSAELLHGLIKILMESEKKADWALNLDWDQQGSPAASMTLQ